jgi:hypothetical protein
MAITKPENGLETEPYLNHTRVNISVSPTSPKTIHYHFQPNQNQTDYAFHPNQTKPT